MEDCINKLINGSIMHHHHSYVKTLFQTIPSSVLNLCFVCSTLPNRAHNYYFLFILAEDKCQIQFISANILSVCSKKWKRDTKQNGCNFEI